jgi:hypothetical protein
MSPPKLADSYDIYSVSGGFFSVEYRQRGTRYINKYGTYEARLATRIANSPRTRSTIYTWPQSRIALSYFDFKVALFGWDFGATWVRATGLFNLWGVECTVVYRYNGTFVFTDNSNSCHAWGVGFGVTITPVTWNDGGANWGGMEYGADYRVSVVTNGFPVAFDHWVRQGIYVNGSVGPVRGS